ncbi:EpsG-like putative glucosyltransferase [Paraburkholderia sp. GV068]|uniref:EpsG family protein n=1 Tax=unclassified Paraburkholderia TaxID=2615204 RepID=UPI000D2F4A7B|nr:MULTISPECIES: EpsG family protein [unclassified Paraburkholderia]PTQ97376.1 EpsG-like putative glucosyltransferase [Paraburkholderia sp. GV072]PUB02915.1 EpsG-like putative glucosyltransferase [Paraburkholderia sp. GV068]
MTYYLVPLLFFYLGVALCVAYGGTSTAVIVTCALPMVALAALRGHCGTDTAAYYQAFADLGQGNGYGGEPLFNAYARLLWAIEPDPRFVVNSVSMTTALLLLWSISRSRHGIWFGGLVLVPGMFYELTMNVMRFGLAASIFLLATRFSPQRKPLRYFIFAVVGTCVHFSSALLFLLFVATTRRGHTITFVGAALAVAGGSLLVPGYLADKTSLYTGIEAPNATSGLLFLLIQLLMLGVMVMHRRQFAIPPVGWMIFAVLAAALYGMTQVTYAGIRFQLILVYLMLVVLWRQFAPPTGRMNTRLAAWLFAIGLIALAGRIHNMSDEEGRGASPFLPYRAAPELRNME